MGHDFPQGAADARVSAVSGGVPAVLGEWPLGVRLVQAVLGTVSVGLVYLLTRRLEPNSQACKPASGAVCRTAALAAATLAAINPYYIAISELLLSEALFIPLMLATLWGLAVLWRKRDEVDRLTSSAAYLDRDRRGRRRRGRGSGKAVVRVVPSGAFAVLARRCAPDHATAGCSTDAVQSTLLCCTRICAGDEPVVDSQREDLWPIRAHVGLARCKPL